MASLQVWYYAVPPITRTYVTLAIIVTGACSLELVSPFALYFNMHLVFGKMQLWRLFTNFFFFGALGVDFLFHMFFLARYCRLLEEGSFRGRTCDFVLMLLFGGGVMCATSVVAVTPPFLGSSLAFMMVYVWARRNDDVRMSFLGLFTFRAPYLPWVLLGFSVLLGNSSSVDLMGIGVGHLYFFCDDVLPYTRGGRGRRPLRSPSWLLRLVDWLSHMLNSNDTGGFSSHHSAGLGRVVHAQAPGNVNVGAAVGGAGEQGQVNHWNLPAAGVPGDAAHDAAG